VPPAVRPHHLAIHPGALGDVVLAVPALRALRRGGAVLTLAAQPRIGALLVALGAVDHCVDFDTLGLDSLFGDAPLSPEAPLARHLSAAARVVCWFGARDDAFVRRLRTLAPEAAVAPPHTPSHVVWQHLLGTVGGTAECAPIAVSPAILSAGRDALRAIGWDGVSRVLIVHPGAGGAAKRWPADAFVSALDGVNATIVVNQGPADGDAVEAFVARARHRTLRLIEPPLPTLAGALASASLYVGNDSGVSHVAAAVGTRSVVLFARPSLPWVPWSDTARCVVVTMAEPLAEDLRMVRAAIEALA
jgi:hypothetical protein